MNLTTSQACWLLSVFILIGAIWASNAKAETVGVMAGHWGHHWVSDVPNERHNLICIRVEWIQGCSFDNSHKQPGFSGESYSLGFVHDFEIWSNVNRWRGDVVIKGSIGLNYGYTEFAGHDWSDKDYTPYVAGGPFYQQPIEHTDGKWEAGFLQFGDDTIPAVGLLWSF